MLLSHTNTHKTSKASISITEDISFVPNDSYIRIGADLIELLFNNSKGSIAKIISYIGKTIEYHQVHLILTPEIVDLSRRTFYTAVSFLIEEGVLARVEGNPNLYAINPMFIYKGSVVNWIRTREVADEMVELGIRFDPLIWLSPTNIAYFGSSDNILPNEKNIKCYKWYLKYLEAKVKK